MSMEGSRGGMEMSHFRPGVYPPSMIPSGPNVVPGMINPAPMMPGG
jgi:hypothetical protein